MKRFTYRKWKSPLCGLFYNCSLWIPVIAHFAIRVLYLHKLWLPCIFMTSLCSERERSYSHEIEYVMLKIAFSVIFVREVPVIKEASKTARRQSFIPFYIIRKIYICKLLSHLKLVKRWFLFYGFAFITIIIDHLSILLEKYYHTLVIFFSLRMTLSSAQAVTYSSF